MGVYIAIIGTWTFNWGAYGSLVYNEMVTNSGALWGKVLWYGCLNILSMAFTYHFGENAIFYLENVEIRQDLCVYGECKEEEEVEDEDTGRDNLDEISV